MILRRKVKKKKEKKEKKEKNENECAARNGLFLGPNIA
jgi:hypothetical protein